MIKYFVGEAKLPCIILRIPAANPVSLLWFLLLPVRRGPKTLALHLQPPPLPSLFPLFDEELPLLFL